MCFGKNHSFVKQSKRRNYSLFILKTHPILIIIVHFKLEVC